MPRITPQKCYQGTGVSGHQINMPLPWDSWPPLKMPDQSRYGTATTDPLGRDGTGWHKGKNGLPVRTKGESK